MGICWFNMNLLGLLSGDNTLINKAVKAATGWDMSREEALQVGRRAANLMRAFNLRNGLTADLDAPSPRYGSTPVDGPAKGVSIMPHWDQMRRDYYELVGWDRETGKPLPETLKSLGLEHIIDHVWNGKKGGY